MQVEAFNQSPVGHLVPISGIDGRIKQPYNHFSFVPTPLRSVVELSSGTYKLISEADRALGSLDALTDRLPNPSAVGWWLPTY